MVPPDGTPDRYARQRLIPGWDQARLAEATAVVVGVGALGNEVAKNLALLGLGRIVLCDPDTVAPSNLSRTVLFDGPSLRRPKVDAAAAALYRLAPATQVVPRRDDLVRGVGLGELADAAVVLGCLDTRRARLQLLGRCALVGGRLVDGGTHPWGGEVRLRLTVEEACYGCSLTPGQRAAHDLPANCDDLTPEPQPASILSTSLVAAWMTTAAVRVVLGERVPWRFLAIDAAAGGTAPVQVTRDPGCPHHQPIGSVEPLPLGRTATVSQLLSALPDAAEPLAWALFPRAGICYHCSQAYSFGYAQQQTTARCPRCGEWIRVRLSQRVRDAGPDTMLYELGIAPQEILTVRLAQGEYRWIRLSR